MKITAVALTVLAGGLFAGCHSGQPIDELRTHANESFQRQEYKRTVAFDTEILRVKPDDYGATFQRGVAYDRMGDVTDAQTDYTKAVELEPDAPSPRLYRANLCLRTNQVDQAVPDVEALEALNMTKDQQVASLVLAGTVSQKKGDYNGALRSFNNAIAAGRGDMDPSVARHTRDAMYNAAECDYRIGNFEQACALYTEIVDTKSRTGEEVTEDDSYTLGVLQYLKGDFASARKSFASVSAARKAQAAKLLQDEGFFTVAAAR